MRSVLTRVLRIPGFAVWFVLQMIRANAQVAGDLLTPGSALRPAIVAYRTRCRTPLELTALSNLITLTPGTLSIDLSTDEGKEKQHTMYILGLYAPADPEAFRAELAELEQKMLRVLRAERSRGRQEARR